MARTDLHLMVFIGRHPVLIFFATQFIKYLQRNNIDYYVVNADVPETYNSPLFDAYALQNNVAVFMFNNIGIGMQTDGAKNFWKEHNIPVFNLIVDHPRNYGDSLRNPVCDIYVGALDMDHVGFVKEHYSKLKGVFFSPNGGTDIGKSVPYKERRIDVLYMGDCQREVTSFPVFEFLGDRITDYYNFTISALNNNPALSTDNVIDQFLESNNIQISENDKYQLVAGSSGCIENVIRRKTKLEGMKALDDAGVHVEVYGGGWKTDKCPFTDNISIHERIDINELLPLLCNAKISLCFMPWFKRGCSEKNFDSMLNGALCVTDRSEYLEKNYRDGENIIYFDLNNPAQMAADVRWLLDHPEAAEKIAKRGYETAKKYDTWDNRFEMLLERIEESLREC